MQTTQLSYHVDDAGSIATAGGLYEIFVDTMAIFSLTLIRLVRSPLVLDLA